MHSLCTLLLTVLHHIFWLDFLQLFCYIFSKFCFRLNSFCCQMCAKYGPYFLAFAYFVIMLATFPNSCYKSCVICICIVMFEKNGKVHRRWHLLANFIMPKKTVASTSALFHPSIMSKSNRAPHVSLTTVSTHCHCSNFLVRKRLFNMLPALGQTWKMSFSLHHPNFRVTNCTPKF